MNILITGIGGPTPRSFAKSLKKFGSFFKDDFIIGTDINPLAIGLYQKDLFDKTYIIPPATRKDYWKRINEIIEENNIEIAVILPELEVTVWSEKAKESTLPCKVLLPDSRINDVLVDKSKMTELFNEFNLVPPSISFNRNHVDLNKVFNDLGNVFWVRSSSGTSGLGSLKIESKEALLNWIDINPNVEHFLASKYLPGRNLACKLLYWEGKLIRSACGERVNYIMSKVAPSGITGNTSFGRLLNEPNLVKKAIDALDIVFEKTNSVKHGFFTVDFKEDEKGVAYITEINVRHVAFTQCFAAAGANFAEDTLRLIVDDPTLDKNYKMYEFEPGTIFLRDVDELPVIMKEKDLLRVYNG